MDFEEFHRDMRTMTLHDALIKHNLSFKEAFDLCHRHNLSLMAKGLL